MYGKHGKKQKTKNQKLNKEMHAYNIDFEEGCFDLNLGSRKLVQGQCTKLDNWLFYQLRLCWKYI